MSTGSFCNSCGSALKEGALYCGNCGTVAATGPTATAVPPPTMVGTVGGSAPATPYHPGDQPLSLQVEPNSSGIVSTAREISPLQSTDYASFGRRVGAYIIDAIPPVLIYIVGGATLLAAITGRSRGGVSFAVILFLALPIVYFIVLWAMAAKGSSPGKALLGIRVVRESNGRFPGAGLGLGRLLLMGLLIGITLYIGGFSPLWDKSGRRKGWWDSAAGTVVLNLSAIRGYRSMVGVPSETADANVIPPTSPESPVSPGSLQDESRGASDVPEWELPLAKAPSMSTKAPAATWSDRPADPRSPGPQVPPPAAPAGSASTGRSMSTADVPWRSSSPAGSALISTIPGLQPTGAQDDLEHTRMAQGKAVRHSAPEWELQFTTEGRSH